MTMATKIAFFDAKSYDRETFGKVNSEYGYEIQYFKERLSMNTVSLTRGATIVCIFVNAECDERVIERMKENGVKLIALRCAGFNNVDIHAAHKHGLRVVRVPAYSPHAVAEYAVTLMLALNRKVYRSVYRTREGNFRLGGLMGFDMYGKTAGIVGMGRIAKELIKILRGFGMNILAYDLYPDEAFAKEHQVKMVTLDELYEGSDIISLHCPLTEETKFIINNDSITKMKYGVMIINTGRGKLIKTEDLINGLRSHQVGSAALDVYEEEADYFYEDRSDRMIDDDKLALLLMMPNVIVTSHQAFFTREATRNIALTTLQNIRDFEEGKELVNEVK
jgi:D-lactate dehydrogenase